MSIEAKSLNQREIKFKAWHKPTKRMFNVYSFGGDAVFEDSIDGVHTSPTLPADRQDCELLQFTGLTDRNRNKIYEGDILKASNSRIEIIYDCAAFFGRYLNIEEKGEPNLQNSNYLHWEIIGNIYENPELLQP